MHMWHTTHLRGVNITSAHSIGGLLGSVCSAGEERRGLWMQRRRRRRRRRRRGRRCVCRDKFLSVMWAWWGMHVPGVFVACVLCQACVLPRLYWLLMGLSPSLRARLFEWISSFTKADSGDDHVPLYSKGSQPPSQWVACYTHTYTHTWDRERRAMGGWSEVSFSADSLLASMPFVDPHLWPHFGVGPHGSATIN